MSKSNRPRVEHKKYSVDPFGISSLFGHTLKETRVTGRNGRSTTGVDYTRSGADKKAGDKYRTGKRS